MRPFLELGLAGVLPPLVVSLLAIQAGRRLAPGLPWAPPLAVGLGYAAGHVATHGVPAFPFVGVKQGILYVGAGAALAGLAQVLLGERRRAVLLLRAIVALAVPWCLLGFKRRADWPGLVGVLATLGLGLALLAIWSGAAGPRARRATTVPVLLVGAAAAGVALGLARSASLAQLSGVLAAASAPLWLVRGPGPASALHGGVAAFAPVYAGFLLAGAFAAELPAPSAWLLAALPLASRAGELLPLEHAESRRATVVSLVLAALLGAGAVAIVASTSLAPYGSYG